MTIEEKIDYLKKHLDKFWSYFARARFYEAEKQYKYGRDEINYLYDVIKAEVEKGGGGEK